MTDQDRQKLAGVHPKVVAAVEAILNAMAAAGTPMFVSQGLRTQAQQQALYAQGRTTLGPRVSALHPLGLIVTMKDGVIHRSDHQAYADGTGHAVDLAFKPKVGWGAFDERWPWETYGLAVEANKDFVWGGRWSHPHDSPHMEWEGVPAELSRNYIVG